MSFLLLQIFTDTDTLVETLLRRSWNNLYQYSGEIKKVASISECWLMIDINKQSISKYH